MDTKSLLYGLIGFFVGGLLVATAATTFDKPHYQMNDMTAELNKKTGDDYDKAFIDLMIEHHQAAIDMATLSKDNAKHQEIKQLSGEIITAQQEEIDHMRQWQQNWGY